jgi:hypothetical protein
VSRWGRSDWLEEIDSDELRWAARDIEQVGFWQFVDSQASYAVGHRGDNCPEHVTPWFDRWNNCADWTHRRNGEWCVAANSRMERCSARAEDGIPFCSNHFAAAWTAMNAYVVGDRHELARRRAESARERTYSDAGMDVAAVRDARRLLEQSAERVYFFAVAEAVKIGRSIHPEKRVKTLQGTKAPEGLNLSTGELIGTIPGGCHVESELHRTFHAHRLVGEWFSLPPIRERIEQLIETRATPEERAA